MYRAVATLDEAAARSLSAVFMEDGSTGAVSSAAVEQADGRWLCEAVFEAAPDPGKLSDYAEMMIGEAVAFAIEELPDIDWVAKSLAGLSSVTAGRFVVHGGHERDTVPVNAVAVEIEAAQAFGTGHHATTWGCLMALDRLFKRRRHRRPLDLGCGSGVLAIAVAKRLRRPVVASDVDPLAVRIAAENARLNAVGPYVEVLAAAGMTHRRFVEIGRFDLIVANILARPLMAIAGDVTGRLEDGGDLILSGLRVEDVRRVFAAYRAHGLCRVARIERDGWATLILRKPRRGRETVSRSDRFG